MLRTSFSPRMIANLAFWVDAADATTLYDATTGGNLVAADGAVARWQDKSGNGRHASQSTANNRPAFKTAVQNGLPCVRFDGSNDSLATSSFVQTVAFTLFLAHKNSIASVNAFARFFERGANTGMAVVCHNSVLNYSYQYASANLVQCAALNTSPRLIQYFSDNASTRNQTFVPDGASQTTGTSTFTPSTPLGLYLSQWGGGGYNGAQDVYEVCYYDRLLSSTERSAVASYLRAKWKL